MKTERPSYRGTQQNLYTLARKAWSYCLLYIVELAAKNGKYTPAFVDAQVKVVDVAEELPDYDNRKDIPADTYDQMQQARVTVLDEWQFLKGYTKDAFSPSLLRTKLDAAGQGHYRLALEGSLDSTASLINAAKTFMSTNENDLRTKGNMPESFSTNFNTISQTFTTIRNTYFDKNDTKDAKTWDKFGADAAILKELKPMLRLGSRIFKHDEAKRSKFIYSRLLDEVRGNSPAGLRGRFTAADTQAPIARVRIRAINKEYETLSEADGRYDLDMASGKYDIEISAPGYQTVVIPNRKISVGVRHRLNLALEPVAVPALTHALLNGLVSPPTTASPLPTANNGVG